MARDRLRGPRRRASATTSTRRPTTSSTSAAARTATRSSARRTSSSASATRCTPRPPTAARSSPSAAATSSSATPTSSATRRSPGIGLVDLRTVREDGPRLIGNVAIEVELPGLTARACSPASRTTAGARTSAAGEQPLGRVLRGHGNTGASGVEGVRRGGVIGTYLHGPLLPKNAWFADWLIATALGLEDAPRAPGRHLGGRGARERAPRRRRLARSRSAAAAARQAVGLQELPGDRLSGPSCRGRRPRSSTASRRWSAAC